MTGIYRITRFVVPTDNGNVEYDLQYVQDWRDNFGDVVPRTVRLPGAHGGYDEYGVDPAPGEIGNVQGTLKHKATPASAMVSWLDTLRSASRQKKGRLYMQPADETEEERWCSARLNNLTTNHSENAHTGIMMEAKFSFQVSDPHWYKQGTEAPEWGFFVWGESHWGGTATQQAVSGVLTDLTETVSGGTVETFPRITISCNTGETAQNIVIQRLVGGVVKDQLTFTDTLVAGDAVVINCRAKSVKKNGSDAYANLTATRAQWFRLNPGANSIRVTMANASDQARVRFSYLHAFI